MTPPFPAYLPREFVGRAVAGEPLARHTSWHVGGAAEVFFSPHDAADVVALLMALPAAIPVLWIGLGSNLLIRDGGLKGVVISTHGTLDRFDRLNHHELAHRALIRKLDAAGDFEVTIGSFGGEVAAVQPSVANEFARLLRVFEIAAGHVPTRLSAHNNFTGRAVCDFTTVLVDNLDVVTGHR